MNDKQKIISIYKLNDREIRKIEKNLIPDLPAAQESEPADQSSPAQSKDPEVHPIRPASSAGKTARSGWSLRLPTAGVPGFP